jgi:hypothetical protein
MEQIFDFQFSKEVYVRLRRRLIRAAKWHIVPIKGLFSSCKTRFSHVRRKSLNLLKFHISAKL